MRNNSVAPLCHHWLLIILVALGCGGMLANAQVRLPRKPANPVDNYWTTERGWHYLWDRDDDGYKCLAGFPIGEPIQAQYWDGDTWKEADRWDDKDESGVPNLGATAKGVHWVLFRNNKVVGSWEVDLKKVKPGAAVKPSIISYWFKTSQKWVRPPTPPYVWVLEKGWKYLWYNDTCVAGYPVGKKDAKELQFWDGKKWLQSADLRVGQVNEVKIHWQLNGVDVCAALVMDHNEFWIKAGPHWVQIE